MSVGNDLRHAQRDRSGGTLEHVSQVDENPRVMILAASVKFGLSARGPLLPSEPREQRLEKIAEVVRTVSRAARELEAGIPVGRWPELLARLPVLAELIIGRPLVDVAEDLVGFADFLKLSLSCGILVEVGVKFARELAIGPLDFILRRHAFEPKNRIIVFELHANLLPAATKAERLSGPELGSSLNLLARLKCTRIDAGHAVPFRFARWRLRATDANGNACGARQRCDDGKCQRRTTHNPQHSSSLLAIKDESFWASLSLRLPMLSRALQDFRDAKEQQERPNDDLDRCQGSAHATGWDNIAVADGAQR